MKKKQIILLHLVFWIVFLGMPLMSAYLSGWDLPLRYFVRLYVMAFYDVLIFYIAYLCIKPYELFKGKKVNFLLIILFILMLSVVRVATTLVTYYIFGIQLQKTLVSAGVFIEETFDTLLFVLFPVFIRLALEWSRTEKLKAELLAQTKSSEIALLRSQINPHFLFNTLNNIYSLVYQKSDKAPSAVMKLSEIMRYMLYETNAEKVALNKELNYILSFIELQELRINNSDYVKYELKGNSDNRRISPMILIPFIENAFKHGSKKAASPGITININLESDVFIFDISNYIKKNDETMDKDGGIGLHNLQRRLELIYPGKHKLEIKNDGEIYSVHLEIEESN